MKLQEMRKERQDIDNLMKKGIFRDDDTGRDYFTGYDYKTLYDWDQYFEAIVQAYMGWDHQLISNGVTIFLDHQREDGHIARSVPDGEFHRFEHVKPFLAQSAVMVYRFYGDLEWLNDDYMVKMERYLDFWLFNRDIGNTGLSVWESAPHTGMDNQHERAGWWSDAISRGVDLNSYLVRECRAFATILEIKGRKDDALRFRTEADARAERIRTRMWDDEDGFFYDIHVKTGKQIPVKSAAGFMPMWADIASSGQAERLVAEHLLNTREFWSKYPVATLAKSEPGYAKGLIPHEKNVEVFKTIGMEFAPENIWQDIGCSWRAHTWIPTNYMIYHALKQYGYDAVASALVHQTDALMKKAGNREYYESETGCGSGLDPFWGWSLLGWFFEYEQSCGFDITAINRDRITLA